MSHKMSNEWDECVKQIRTNLMSANVHKFVSVQGDDTYCCYVHCYFYLFYSLKLFITVYIPCGRFYLKYKKSAEGI